MREIKFRAWNKKINTMGSALPLRVWTDDIATDIGREKYLRDKDNIILMQYTGLKDKNGKEIYEGDVVWCGQFDRNTGRKLIGKIESADENRMRSAHRWYIGGFTLIAQDSIADFDEESKWEVIGNIYENPELLT